MAENESKPRFSYWDGTWAGVTARGGKPYTVRQVLGEIKRAGYTGVELGTSLEALGPAAALKATLAGLGLEVATIVVPTLAPDARARVDYAAEFGLKVLMVGGGARPPDRLPRPGDMQPYAEALWALAEYAGRYGMELAQHTHPRSITGATEEALMLMEQVPDSVGVCVDVAHLMQAGSDPVEAIRTLGSRVKHVHLKDYRASTDELLELGQGDVDLPGVMTACWEVGYRGWYSVELDQSKTTPLRSALLSRRYLTRIGY
ncbi:MAG: sugar phosphate isomerase/epimerase family protein [Anaerolineae bacterium]